MEVHIMPVIRPSCDLRNKYNEISKLCHETNKPVYITKNGAGDLVVMSIELFEKLEKGLKSVKNCEEYSIDEVFDEIESEVWGEGTN